MAEVIYVCGKICSGKTTYAYELAKKTGSVVLSVDEVMLCIFGQHAGDRHDEYAAKTEKYLLEKSLELIACGVGVILDWGAWTGEGRKRIRDFYAERNVPCRFHCINISEETRHRRIQLRNASVLAGETNAYFLDENLSAKFESRYENPTAEEIDLWITEDLAE